MRRPGVLVDRDGVLNQLHPDPRSATDESPLDADDVRLVDGAAGALRSLRAAGFALVVVSNQPAAAKGTVDLDTLRAVHDRVAGLLAAEDASPDGWLYCLHHPQGVVDGLSGPCLCRKPAPGLLLQAAVAHDLDLAQTWIVGDADTDVQAGRGAGVRTVLVAHPGSAHRRSGVWKPDLQAGDLEGAAQLIVGQAVG